MSSHSSPTSGRSLLLCLAPLLLPLLLAPLDGAEGASFRDHRLRGSEAEPPGEAPHRGPDQDMLKALRHIENLRHRTGGAPPLRPPPAPQSPEYDGGLLENAQALRAMLTPGAVERTPGGGQEERPGWQRKGGAGGGGEEEWEGEDNRDQGDKTQEWFQAVLRALEQTEPANTAHRPAGGRTGAGLRLGERAAPSHEAPQLMFEDDEKEEEEGTHKQETADEKEEEEEEGDGEEEEEEGGEEGEGGEGGERGTPFVRRTGEGVGEKYTPQKLATLQSIFDEVERMANGGGGKEEEEEEEEEEGGVGEEGQKKEELSTRSLAYDDVARGLIDWAPLRRAEEEEVEGDEEEEEQRGNKPIQADQVLDYSEDEDDGAEEEAKDEEQEGEGLSAKRSTDARPTEDADDMANLVDYYLLKVLEKTEEEEKREIEEEKEEEEEEEEEEKERAERKVSPFQYWDNRTPQQDMHQLIRLSQKYQVPPEELLAMLQAGGRSNTKPPKSSGLARAHNRITQRPPSLGSRQFNRHRTPDRQSSSMPKDARTQEILNILGLAGVRSQSPAPLKRPPQYQVSQSRFQPQPRRQEKYPPSQIRVAPNKLKESYDDNVGEDELATYLAAKILAQYPAPTHKKKTGQKRSAFGSVWRDADEEPGALGSFEQAMQDYFDQMDSGRGTQQQQQQRRRQSAAEDMGGAAQTQIMDDDALMKMMSFLSPQGPSSQEE